MKTKLLKIREALVKANEISLSTYNVDIYDGDIIYRRAGGSFVDAIKMVDELIAEQDEQFRLRERFKRA